MSHTLDVFSYSTILAVVSILVTFILSFRMFPVIIYISQKKKLMETPGERNSHDTKTPSLGGVGLFVSFSLGLILIGLLSSLDQLDLTKLLSVLAATIILLFLGIKDDLVVLAPKQKFVGQLVSACIVIFMTDVRIENFNGLMGIGEVPYIISVVFTLFVYILVINAYNLVDGIDGLAGSLAIISSITFGIFFAVNGHNLLLLVSFVLIGALLGFLRYNLSKKNKLFMGDSGSLFIGYLLAYQGVSFLYLNSAENSSFIISNGPVILLAALSFPLLDTLRVFAVRIKNKKSPFIADRNHIHHRLLNIGCSHKQASLAISLANILVIIVAFLSAPLNINIQLGLVVVVGVAIYLTPFMFALKDASTKIKQHVPLESLANLEEQNAHVRLRNALIANNKTKDLRFDEENGLLFIDGEAEPINIFKDELKSDFAKKRAWNHGKFVASKKRQKEIYKN